MSHNTQLLTLNSFFSINCDAPVRAHNAAGGAANAGLFIDGFYIGIAMYIDLAGKGDDVLRTCFHAEHASFATGGINDDGAFHFCHIVCVKKMLPLEKSCKGSDIF